MKPGGGPEVRLPAEWEPHDATWLAYPHWAADWPGKLAAVRWAFVEFVRILQRHERVRLLVRNETEADRFRRLLWRGGGDPDRVDIRVRETNRSWLRDTGPTFVLHGGQLAGVCWRFTGWARYANHQLDAQVGRFITGAAGAFTMDARAGDRPLAMEGGAIDSNGRGLLLATEECLLGQGRHARNPSLPRTALEEAFRRLLGTERVLWLGGGIAGDDTSGHVDTVARFVGPRQVAASVESDRRDENFEPLRENLRRLRRMRDDRGHPLEIAELPMPQALHYDGDRLPAGYANFYIANGAVLVPTFNDPNDRVALRVLEQCFPDREIYGIHCGDLILGLGALHCLAQQQPRPGAAANIPNAPAPRQGA